MRVSVRKYLGQLLTPPDILSAIWFIYHTSHCYVHIAELLNITSAANNGTVGSLRDILDPRVAKKLPPSEAPGGSPGVEDVCPFPSDNHMLESRSICTDCVCNASCHVNHTEIVDGNRLNFNHTAAEGNGWAG